MTKASRCWMITFPLLAASAHAGSRPIQRGETLIHQVPAGFKAASASDRGGVTMQEFIPRTESLQDWTAMVTIQTFKAASDLKPGKFLIEFGKNYAATCPALSHTNILNGSSNGYPTSLLAIQCPDVRATGKPENLYIRAIRGTDDFYVVQYAYRHVVTDAEKISLGRYLESVIACDPRTVDHPCPVK